MTRVTLPKTYRPFALAHDGGRFVAYCQRVVPPTRVGLRYITESLTGRHLISFSADGRSEVTFTMPAIGYPAIPFLVRKRLMVQTEKGQPHRFLEGCFLAPKEHDGHKAYRVVNGVPAEAVGLTVRAKYQAKQWPAHVVGNTLVAVKSPHIVEYLAVFGDRRLAGEAGPLSEHDGSLLIAQRDGEVRLLHLLPGHVLSCPTISPDGLTAAVIDVAADSIVVVDLQ